MLESRATLPYRLGKVCRPTTQNPVKERIALEATVETLELPSDHEDRPTGGNITLLPGHFPTSPSFERGRLDRHELTPGLARAPDAFHAMLAAGHRGRGIVVIDSTAAHGFLACMIVLGTCGAGGQASALRNPSLAQKPLAPLGAATSAERKGVFTPCPLEAMSSRPLFRIPISFDESLKSVASDSFIGPRPQFFLPNVSEIGVSMSWYQVIAPGQVETIMRT
jgi:hypothetical protein